MKRHSLAKEIPIRTWQMSFNDLLTVLLTFFILLVSVSEINVSKVQDLSLSVSDVFGTIKSDDQQTALLRSIGAVEGINARPVEGGISIVLPESLVFSSGSAELIHKEMLKGVGEKLKSTEGSIRVEGHTDSIPVATRSFPSNWELSTQRAVNVVKFLASDCGIDPQHLSAAGYGDSRPVASNESPENRALNRRVNLIVSLK
jgi:chemotaxis protein MotB